MKKSPLVLQEQTVFLNVDLKYNELATHQPLPHIERKPVDKQQQISAEHLESHQNDGHDESHRMVPAHVPQFHSLYNSQLSVSQRNKLVRPIENAPPPNGWNGLEIAVYAAMGLLMAASLTACFVFAVKQKNTQSSPEFTTVTTVKPNDPDPGFNAGNGNLNGYLNGNASSRLNKMLNEWPWLQQQANKFNKTDDDEGQLSYDANGNPIIQSRVTLRTNPFDEEEAGQEDADRDTNNKNRQSIISYPGSEISIQITANPIVNALENVVNSALKRANGDEKNKRVVEEPATPEPDLQEIKNMLNYCRSIPPPSKLAAAGKSASGHRRQPPPIPARKDRQTNSATFVRGKRAPNQQLPVHVPGIACRTLNAVNVQPTANRQHSSEASSNDSSLTNSINNSPINSSNKTSPVNLSPSLSLSSSDSGIQNSAGESPPQNVSPVDEPKHLITNPFLSYPEETGVRPFTREPPSYAPTIDELNEPTDEPTDETTEEQIYTNTTSPPVPKHSSAQQRQRTRIIPPKSLFEEMNYNEIVNYIEGMEESTA